jgi:hypothetical protein
MREPKTVDLEPAEWKSETHPPKYTLGQELKAKLIAGLLMLPVLLIVQLFVAPNAGTQGAWCGLGWEKHCAIFDPHRK